MSFVDQPDAPGAGRVGLGLVAAAALPIAALLTGYGEGFIVAVMALPQLILLFLPLALWLLPKLPLPLLASALLGAITAPLTLASLVLPSLGFDWEFAKGLIAWGAVGGCLYWLVVAAGNPYFSSEARRDRAAR